MGNIINNRYLWNKYAVKKFEILGRQENLIYETVFCFD